MMDVRYALRSLTHSPGFAIPAILCLAVGIGVNSAIYSVVDVISIRPLPFKDAHQLVVVHPTRLADGVGRSDTSFPDFVDWRASARTFSGMAAYTSRSFTVTDGPSGSPASGDAERLLGGLVSWDLFPMLGIDPVVGRHFREDEDRAGAPGVAIVSHAVWQRRYLSDPHIVGRVIYVNGEPHTVVGVMPPRFQFPEQTQMWVPIAPRLFDAERGDRSLTVFARLNPGATIDQGRAEMASIAANLSSYREDDGWSASARPLRDELMPDDVRLISVTLMGAVTLVLLIACGNVANLLLARASAREREIAVRAALGAGRGRIVRQVLTESVLIGTMAAPLGIAIAYAGLRWLTASVPADAEIPYYIDWTMNWRVVAYTGLTAIFTSVLFGLAPAVHAADGDLHRSLKDGGRGTGGSLRRSRLRNGLVVAEIALALVLLVGASLFIRSFLNLQRVNTGIRVEPLMTMRLLMTGEAYDNPDARVRRVQDIVDRLDTLPGVETVFASNFVPFNGGGGGSPVLPEGQAFEQGKEPYATFVAATAGALPTLGIPLLAGRDLEPRETETRSAVAVVNRAFARWIWPSATDVLGRRFRMPEADPDQWFTIVGLVGDFQVWEVSENEPVPIAFVGYPYMPAPNTGLTIKVVGGSPSAIVSAAREQIRQVDPALPMFEVRSGEDNARLTFWADRLLGGMFTIFGVVALLLAAVGIYGVLSYSVAQRTREIGVRVALGAGRRDVFRLVLGQGARLAVAGIVLGVIGAAAATQVIVTILYNVSATDPAAFFGTALFLAAVALFAGYIPARRATSVDPIIALRTE